MFNQAAQVWNHTFYWNCMTPDNGGGEPTGDLKAKIEEDFGSYDKFREEFKNAALTQFGSGWAWLVADKVGGKLSIAKTANADTPLAHDQIAVLTCDVWEHAYYVDYRNRRPDYVDTFLDKLVNWDYANAKYKGQDAGVEA
jgi:Fe-Mn family superoxide dismutase